MNKIQSFPIKGKDYLSVIPDFDLYNCNLLTNLSITLEETSHYEFSHIVEIKVVYKSNIIFQNFLIHIMFSGVRKLALPDFITKVYFSELEFYDISNDQLEGIKYKIVDHGLDSFEILSNDIEIISCNPCEND